MEWLDIVDEDGKPTGEVVERTRAHAEGIRHRTSHVWLLRKRPAGVEVLLQKRSQTKDSFPGCYDISSAGHIPAGSDVIPSAMRELSEELGLSAQPKAFHYLGVRRFFHQNEFYGHLFVDRQVSFVYALWMDVEPEAMKLQMEEVESVRWMRLSDCIRGVKDGTLHSCLYEEELEMVRQEAERGLREELLGALVGLARATDGNTKTTEKTGALICAGLAALGENAEGNSDGCRSSFQPQAQQSDGVKNQLKQPDRIYQDFIDEIHAEKRILAPDCAACGAPCGKTADYDLGKLNQEPEPVQELKKQLIERLEQLACLLAERTAGGPASSTKPGVPEQSERAELEYFLTRALFAIGEGWEAEWIEAVVKEAEEKIRV